MWIQPGPQTALIRNTCCIFELWLDYTPLFFQSQGGRVQIVHCLQLHFFREDNGSSVTWRVWHLAVNLGWHEAVRFYRHLVPVKTSPWELHINQIIALQKKKKKWSLGVGGWLPDVKRVILAVFRFFFLSLSLSFPLFLGSIVVGRGGHVLWRRVEQAWGGLYVKSLASASSLHWTPLQVQVKGTICSKAVQLTPPHNRTLVPWLALAHQSALWSSQPLHEGGWQDKT